MTTHGAAMSKVPTYPQHVMKGRTEEGREKERLFNVFLIKQIESYLICYQAL